MQDSLHIFQNLIGYHFKNHELLQRALTHASLSNETTDNQRLEFLGDAVLGLVVAEKLFLEFPEDDEGALDHMRAGIVNGKSLTQTAIALGVDSLLIVSEAHRKHRPQPSDAMLEDALEAIIGALFLDGGIESTRSVIQSIFKENFAHAATTRHGNAKSRLQEWTQKKYNGQTPIYLEQASEGPDHARQYACIVTIDQKELGRGTGSSKKSAETAAAQAALHTLQL